jgi:hypothetical protein
MSAVTVFAFNLFATFVTKPPSPPILKIRAEKFSRLHSLKRIHHVLDVTWITALVLSRDMHPQCGCSMVKSDRRLVMEA